MRKLLATLPIVGVLVFGVMLNAGAQEACTTFQNHSGSVPGSYDYAVFHEDSPLVDLTVETNGQNIFVNPQDYGAGNSWDTVQKCHGTITTTTTQDTTTTTGPDTSSTTTTSLVTTTSLDATTTTAPSVTTTFVGSTTTRSDCETLFEDECLPPTTDPSTPTTPPGSDSTLPYTGMGKMTWMTLVFVAAVSGVLGFMLVMGGREE